MVAHCAELRPEHFAGTLYRESWRAFLEWERGRSQFDEEMLLNELRAR